MKKNNQNLKLDRKYATFCFLLSNFCFVILLSIFYFLFSGSIFAAEIFYDADTRKIKENTEFEVGVFLNAESENINAFEGKIIFPHDLLDLKEIRDGNTIVNFWIEKPHKRQETRDKEQGEKIGRAHV